MSLNINQADNTDFKYEMNDLTVLYYGAKYTLREIVDDLNGSMKFRSIVKSYLMKDYSPDTTLESLFYYMEPDSDAYEVFRELRTKVRINIPVYRRKLFGGKERIYKESLMPVSDFAKIPSEEKKKQGIVIGEIQISKMGLMRFTV